MVNAFYVKSSKFSTILIFRFFFLISLAYGKNMSFKELQIVFIDSER